MHFINSALKFTYQPGQREVNQLVVSSIVRLLRFQVVTILFLNMLVTLTVVSYMCKNDLELICVCVCVYADTCVKQICTVTETMVTADKNIDLMLKKFKLMILNILNI